MERRMPRWDELRPLLGLLPPPVSRQARLDAAATIPDLRRIAARRTPRAAFDYVDGAADHETSLWRSRQTFRRTELRPRVLRDVGSIDTTRRILGTDAALPLVLAPTGFTRMMHAAGETAVVRASRDAGLPYTLSTMGTTSPEDVAAAAPDARRWFQLYVWQDRDATERLLDRAAASGYEAVMLTVDTAVAGRRLRDVRNGLTVPPKLTLQTLGDMALHPSWWFDVLTTEPLEFAAMRGYDGTVAEMIDDMFDPTLTDTDLAWLRERWDGPVIVKGVQSVEDARRCVDAGADALVVSNHGGRQLDRAPTPLLQVAEVVDAVGAEVEVLVDGGILSGTDIVIAVAQGARATMIGRAYLYGLMAGGQAGVARALAILADEVARTLALLGVSSPDELTRDHVRLPPVVR